MSYISEMRKFVGHAPIMCVAAMGIIYNEEKGLLLEKRTDTGEWCVPGGAIELGESLEDALRREVKEETNLDISNPKLFDIKANVHMVYPNKDEVYYTDVVYKYTFIMDVVVDKDYRRKGIATALLSEVRKWAEDRKSDYIELNVLSKNIQAISLYENLQFEECAKRMRLKL